MFGALMGECEDNGTIGRCPNRRLTILAIVLVTAALCLLITWTTNRLVRSLTDRGRSAIWGVIGGFGLAAALAFGTFFLALNFFGS